MLHLCAAWQSLALAMTLQTTLLLTTGGTSRRCERCAVVVTRVDKTTAFAAPQLSPCCRVLTLTTIRTLVYTDFIFDRGNLFLSALAAAVPRAEAILGLSPGALPAHRRCLMGSSLSSLLALRSLFDLPETFGAIFAGSPSLVLAPRVLAMAQRRTATLHDAAGSVSCSAAGREVLLMSSEGDDSPNGSSIGSKAREMAAALNALGHRASASVVAGEDHGSCKPSMVSRCLGWLERQVWVE